MDGKYFCIGLALGMLGGALIVANSHKARQIIKDSQEQIKQKAKEMSKENCCDCQEENKVRK